MMANLTNDPISKNIILNLAFDRNLNTIKTKTFLYDINENSVDVDEYSNGLVSILACHRMVHIGRSFFYFACATLSSGQTVTLLVYVPSGTLTHLSVDVDSQAETTFEIFEDITVSDNGSSLSTFNSNRN